MSGAGKALTGDTSPNLFPNFFCSCPSKKSAGFFLYKANKIVEGESIATENGVMVVRAIARMGTATDRRQTEFERLWERERPRVWRLLVHITGNRDAADDLAQEVGVRALEGYAGFRGASSLSTWLSRIAVNTALRWREQQQRHAGRVCFETVSPLLSAEGVTPEESLLRADRSERTQLALEELPDELRTALILHAWEGMKYREIAEALDVPLGTVMSRLHAARKRLRETLAEELG